MDNARPQETGGNLLVVDDDLLVRQTLEALLTREGFEVRCAPNGRMALIFAAEDPPELVLLDIRLPDMEGYQVCRHLKEDPKTSNIPVIFLSGLDEVADKVRGFAAGGVDYIAKPFHREEVLARVESHLELKRAREALKRVNEELEERVAGRTAELAERLRFEELISNLSAKFVNLPSDRVDLEIEDALEQIRGFFGVDRIGLLRVLRDKTVWQITHAAHADDIPPLPVGRDLPIGLFPWVYRKIIEQREVWSFARIEDLPPEAGIDQQTYQEWGIRSAVNIPILTSGGSFEYIVAITADRRECAWPEEYIRRLRALGEIFVNTLERRNARLELEERLRFERLISGLSSDFVRLSAAGVDEGINNWLRRIAEFFGVERSSIGLFSEDGFELIRAFEYHSTEAQPAPESVSRKQLPWYFEQLMRGNPVAINREKDLPVEAEEERQLFLAGGVRSVLSIPLVSGGKTLGSWALVSVRSERVWPEDPVQRFRIVGDLFANALKRKQMEEDLHSRLREIESLKQRLEEENIYLRQEIKLQYVHEEIVGRSEKMKKVLSQVEQVARTDSTVLIQGETGTGKELLARAIHNLSSRKNQPLVTVNCASLPPTLIESELFGREKGAYTGALTRMVGRFEVADGSTLFLDEIGELPQDVQSKLLRVLEEGRFERLGAAKTLQVNVRIIAATNRDLAHDVSEGRFRKDLFYRLNVFPISVPPLRERQEDIPLLVWAFVRQFEKKMGKRVDAISRKGMESLQHHLWPGNIRELRNVIEHAMIMSSGRTLSVTLPKTGLQEASEISTLQDLERKHILDVLAKTEWRIMGAGGAAEMLGLKRTTLQSRMKKLGIKRPVA